MNFILSEVITLTSFGNEYLRAGNLKQSYIDHPFFQTSFNQSFREVLIKGNESEEIILASSLLEWYQFLKEQGCKKIRLYFQDKKNSGLPPDVLAAFAEYLPWFIETVFPYHSDYWVSREQVVYPEALKGKLWSVNYGKFITGGPISNLQLDLIQVKQNFESALLAIEDFAKQHALNSWAAIFRDAYHSLTDENEARRYDALIVSENYELINNQLMLAVGKADVFGGMGSWNDLGFFDDPKEDEKYQKVSEDLYRASHQAILAAINHDRFER